MIYHFKVFEQTGGADFKIRRYFMTYLHIAAKWTIRRSLVRDKKEHQKAIFLCEKEISALPEHACQNKQTIGWNNQEIITTNRRYHQCLCLEAWHINSAQAPLNSDDGGLLPDSYLLLINEMQIGRSLISV